MGMAARTCAFRCLQNAWGKPARTSTTEALPLAPSAPVQTRGRPQRPWSPLGAVTPSPCCARPPQRSRRCSSRRKQERPRSKKRTPKSCCWTLRRWTARRSAHVHRDSFAWTATLQKQWPKLAARSATRGCVATARPRAWKAANGTARRSVPGVTSGTRIIACRCQQSAWGKTATKTAHHRLSSAAQTARTNEGG